MISLFHSKPYRQFHQHEYIIHRNTFRNSIMQQHELSGPKEVPQCRVHEYDEDVGHHSALYVLPT